MNKEHIPVITDREELYDKCENMEQLYDKYYLPLLCKHYSKTYELQEENKKQKEVIDNTIEYINKYESIRAYYEYRDEDGYDEYNCDEDFKSELLDILNEVTNNE